MTFEHVTMMFEELYHHMGSRQMSHDNFLVKVKLQVPFETPGMELVLHVVHHPVVDSHEPLGLVNISQNLIQSLINLLTEGTYHIRSPNIHLVIQTIIKCG